MGYQNLFIIGLISFVVGSGVYMGMRAFDSHNQTNNRDQLITSIHRLVGHCEEYYIKPPSLGGGGGSFTGLDFTSDLLDSPVGTITYRVIGNQVVFTANGKVAGNNGAFPVRVFGIYSNRRLEIIQSN
jgi:hypothetical protein